MEVSDGAVDVVSPRGVLADRDGAARGLAKRGRGRPSKKNPFWMVDDDSAPPVLEMPCRANDEADARERAASLVFRGMPMSSKLGVVTLAIRSMLSYTVSVIRALARDLFYATA